MLAGMAVLILALSFPMPADAQQTGGDQSPAISAGGNVSVSYLGLNPEQVRDLTRIAVSGATGPMAAQIGDLAQKLGATRGAAEAVLRAVGQQNVPLELLPQKLAEAAAEFQKLRTQAAALNPRNPVARDLVDRAQAAIKAGQFAEAHQFLQQARQTQVAAAQQARDLAEQARGAADQDLLQAASASATEGKLSMAELRYLDAATHFQEAAELVPPGHSDDKGRFLLAEAGALEQQGDERGDNAALARAISVYRLTVTEYSRERVPLRWASIQNNLGTALRILGERESGTAGLEQALATYELALRERTRERVPLQWAMTQNDLGVALFRLGQRESGTTRLEQAVAASSSRSRNGPASGCRSTGR